MDPNSQFGIGIVGFEMRSFALCPLAPHQHFGCGNLKRTPCHNVDISSAKLLNARFTGSISLIARSILAAGGELFPSLYMLATEISGRGPRTGPRGVRARGQRCLRRAAVVNENLNNDEFYRSRRRVVRLYEMGALQLF